MSGENKDIFHNPVDRLYQCRVRLRALSELFFCDGYDETRTLEHEAANGFHFLLEDIVEEIRSISEQIQANNKKVD